MTRAGEEIALVPAEPWNVKITTAEDWQLAEAIERGLGPVSTPARRARLTPFSTR